MKAQAWRAVLLFAVAGFAMQSTAMPIHPDVLEFVRMPTAGSASDELAQTAARRLQQASSGDLFRDENGPFTFDGFGFGYGGIFPGGGAFNGFAVNVYNILFRDILNEGLNEYLASAITNNPINPIDFTPPYIGRFFNRDVAILFGFDAVDKYIGQYLTRASAEQGELVDAGCVGPTYSLRVEGGSCEIQDDGSVECDPPSIKYISTPYTCNLPYRSAASLEGQSWRYKLSLGQKRKDEIGVPAGLYNFGAAVNVTVPYLGYSTQLRRIANDFGVQQWYQFTGNVILNELLRVQAALLSGAVDSRLLTAQAQDAANAAAAAALANKTSISQGVAAVRQAGSNLLDRIAAQMGISQEDLRAGLDAVGVLPKGAAAAAEQKQKQQQPKQQVQRKQTQDVQQSAAADIAAMDKEAVDQGGKVVSQRTDFSKGDLALLGEPAVTKAEGQQKGTAVSAAPKKAATTQQKEKKAATAAAQEAAPKSKKAAAQKKQQP